MTTKRKAAASNYPVPQNQRDAADQIGRIGDLRRDIDRREADMNDALAKIKAEVEETIAPVRDELVGLEEGVKTWCEANRALITANGKTKTVDLGTGTVKWRQRPPKVTIRGIKDVLERLKTAGLSQFVRTKEDVDKEAMLKEPALAGAIQGIAISSDGEDFVIEPFGAEVMR